MSARAAWRLENLGFAQVYRYTPGKADWLASGLPVEGSLPGIYRALELASTVVPTCHLGEAVGEVRELVLALGWDTCVVVNDKRVVLGLLEPGALEADAGSAVEVLMDPAPRTYRPNAPIERINRFFSKADASVVLITTGDGQFMGLLRKEALVESE